MYNIFNRSLSCTAQFRKELNSLVCQQVQRKINLLLYSTEAQFQQFLDISEFQQTESTQQPNQNQEFNNESYIAQSTDAIDDKNVPQFELKHKSHLHHEINNFVKLAGLSEQESLRRLQIIEQIQKCCMEIQPTASILPFGSLATGTALKDSDVDLAICNLMQPDDYSRGGYTEESRTQVIHLLKQLTQHMAENLARYELIELVQRARFPLARIDVSNVQIDMSIQDDVGVKQCNYVNQIMQEKWQIRPIVIILKALIRSYQVDSVYGGGMGGYTIVNMVIAFVIMREMRELRVDDLGILLTTFLRYFGFGFDYDNRALSIRRGGLVTKSSVAVGHFNSYRKREQREEMKLCIEDPITGRDISCGTKRMGEIRYAFGDAYRTIKFAQQHMTKIKEDAAVKDQKFQHEFPILGGCIQMDQFLTSKTRNGSIFVGTEEQLEEGDCDLQQGQIGS